jgi:hypothetical protein
MTLMDVLSDPFVWARFFHIAGAIISVGAVTVTDSMLMVLHFRKKFAPVFAMIASELSAIVWGGLAMLSATGMILILQSPGIIYSTIFQMKIMLVSIVFANGILLNERVTPRFREVSDKWAEQENVRGRFERFAGVFAVISIVGWWSVIFLVYLKGFL